MTCIIGVEYGGVVYMGGDSITLNGWSKDIIASKKVFRKGALLFGVAGNPRQAQLIQYYFDVRRDQDDSESDEQYLTLEVVEQIRQLFKDKGFTEFENGRELGASFLLGYKGKLYSVENSFQLCRSARGMYAMGAGDDFALASLMTSFSVDEDGNVDVVKCLLGALEVAAKLSACVAPPFYVEKLESSLVEASRAYAQAEFFRKHPEVLERPEPPAPTPAANPPSHITL